MDVTNIDIAICTFRRRHVADTLRSIAKLALPPDTKIRVIVADNDDTPSARELVETTARECALTITYIHAPSCNISIARNACLDTSTAPFLAFIDDDELVEPGWLAAMLSVMKNNSAEVVLGPVRAIYEIDCPEWLSKGNFYSIVPRWVRKTIITGYTSNAMIKHNSPVFNGLRFRIDLGKSGGEDTEYFSRVYRAGGNFTFAADAIATEAVPAERANLIWLLKRRFRMGQTIGLILLETQKNRLIGIAKAIPKIIYCAIFFILNIAHDDRMAFWLLRATFHVGVIARLLGLGPIQIYGKKN